MSRRFQIIYNAEQASLYGLSNHSIRRQHFASVELYERKIRCRTRSPSRASHIKHSFGGAYNLDDYNDELNRGGNRRKSPEAVCRPEYT
jgi:hypothetical protein